MSKRKVISIKMDINSQEWKDKMEKLNKELDERDGENRRSWGKETFYDKGLYPEPSKRK
jgi:hypothetical protein